MWRNLIIPSQEASEYLFLSPSDLKTILEEKLDLVQQISTTILKLEVVSKLHVRTYNIFRDICIMHVLIRSGILVRIPTFFLQHSDADGYGAFTEKM